MATATRRKPKEDQEPKDPWDQNYAKVPLWLTSSAGGTHAQFHVLVVLITKLGYRYKPVHLNYPEIAGWAETDVNSVTKAVNKFVERGWLLVSGPRNYRLYKLDKEQIAADLYSDQPQEDDE